MDLLLAALILVVLPIAFTFLIFAAALAEYRRKDARRRRRREADIFRSLSPEQQAWLRIQSPAQDGCSIPRFLEPDPTPGWVLPVHPPATSVRPPVAVPAGWYQHPTVPTAAAWWDGHRWTGHTAQRPPGAPTAPAYPAPTSSSPVRSRSTPLPSA